MNPIALLRPDRQLAAARLQKRLVVPPMPLAANRQLRQPLGLIRPPRPNHRAHTHLVYLMPDSSPCREWSHLIPHAAVSGNSPRVPDATTRGRRKGLVLFLDWGLDLTGVPICS